MIRLLAALLASLTVHAHACTVGQAGPPANLGVIDVVTAPPGSQIDAAAVIRIDCPPGGQWQIYPTASTTLLSSPLRVYRDSALNHEITPSNPVSGVGGGVVELPVFTLVTLAPRAKKSTFGVHDTAINLRLDYQPE